MLQQYLVSSARCGRVSLKTKLRIYNAVVIPTLLYGSGTWAITQTEEKKQDVFDNRCLRRIAGVMWFHHVRNTEESKNWPSPASPLLKNRRLRWFGHVCRMGPERLPKSLLSWIPESGKCQWGRWRTRWKDNIKRDAEYAGVEQEPEVVATDRTQ